MFRHRGFTLIELLIVVAIIAILASIAMVNFLEASIRSKTGRAKADIRTITTALESYAVDHNKYPTYHYANMPSSILEFHIGGRVPDWGIPDPDWKGLNPLTTPIAYLTSFPSDPFDRQRRNAPPEADEYLYVNWDYAIKQVTSPSWRNTFIYARYNYGPWRIHSMGPDGEGPDSGIVYDPTNGSRSRGDITYSPKATFDHWIYFPQSSSGGS